MGRHPLLLGAAVLFWGWQADFLVYAALMAAALEATLLVHARMDFKDRDFERISDLSAVLLAGLTLYHFDEHGFQAIFPILQASPFVFLALVLAQRFSTRDRVSHAALFLSVRRGIKKGRIERAGTIDVAYPFFFACLLAASAGNAGEVWFVPGLAPRVGWVLCRPARYGTGRYGTGRDGTVRDGTVRDGTVRYITVRYVTVPVSYTHLTLPTKA